MKPVNYKVTRWSPEEDRTLIERGSNALSRELMQFIPRRTRNAINQRCRTLGIKRTQECQLRKIRQARRAVDPINLRKLDHDLLPDGITFQVLLGSILGDGHIKRTPSGCRYEERHGPDQIDYSTWKVKMLSFFQPTMNFPPYKYIRTRKPQPADGSVEAVLVTPVHPCLSALKSQIYASKKNRCVKTIFPAALASQIDFLGLLVWYLDDGTIGRSEQECKAGRKAQPFISAIGWDRSSLTSALQIINMRLGLSLHLSPFGCVRIDRSDVERLFPVWVKLAQKYDLPECMNYKLEDNRTK